VCHTCKNGGQNVGRFFCNLPQKNQPMFCEFCIVIGQCLFTMKREWLEEDNWAFHKLMLVVQSEYDRDCDCDSKTLFAETLKKPVK